MTARAQRNLVPFALGLGTLFCAVFIAEILIRAGVVNRFIVPLPSQIAGAYSAGFHTTALPHRIAGTRYQDGTATGKFPAVMMAATPTGVRKVNSCLSGISDGTVWP